MVSRENSEGQSRDERLVCSAIQTGFPIVEKPFDALGEKLGMTGAAVRAVLDTLVDDGVVRSMGPVFEPTRLGYRSTLVAAEVELERIAELAAVMLNIREITHNYHRDHEFSVWFTIIALNDDIRKSIIERVSSFPGVKRTMNLPSETVFKLRVLFDAGKDVPVKPLVAEPPDKPLTDEERAIVRALQHDTPVVEQPFSVLADLAGVSQSTLIERVRQWTDDGTIRRFGARLNHHKLGYETNVMAVWNVQNVDETGRRFADIPEVSHCYSRTPHRDWPYELYTMIHARDESGMNAVLGRMKRIAHGVSPTLLRTLYELKKTGMKYFLEDETWDIQKSE